MATQETVAKRRKVRGAHRGVVTWALTRVKDIITGASTQMAPADVIQLTQKRSMLVEKSNMLKQLDEELLESVPDSASEEDLQAEIAEAEAVQESVELAILEIDQVLKIESTAAQPSLHVFLEPVEPPSVAAKMTHAPSKSCTPTPPSTQELWLQVVKHQPQAVKCHFRVVSLQFQVVKLLQLLYPPQ